MTMLQLGGRGKGKKPITRDTRSVVIGSHEEGIVGNLRMKIFLVITAKKGRGE